DLWLKLLLAFLPLVIIGFIFKDQIKTLFNVETVAWMFIIGGFVFLIVEYFYKPKEHTVKEVEEVTYTQAWWVGFVQIFSLVPGTSRAGATIIGGMLSGLDRKTASDFSFLLAIPVMGTVSGYDLLKHYQEFANANWVAFGIGFVVALVVAYITVKLFLVFIQKFTFVPFGIYRIVFGIFLLMII
ncbi:MAG TPA: undecaprenyl-diphosphate phosphatase, partial [Epsilonproteobacteria bacterium]|nr:undecaprenyl-diphosphate phosphatase [Campylobacterota bacterium]